MNRVFVLDTNKRWLMPTTPARARRLRDAGKAAVYKYKPYTLILKYEVEPDNQPISFQVDPGSKTTGIALVGEFPRGRELLWAANLTHRGQTIKKALESRRSLRRSRRNRTLRYRRCKFANPGRHYPSKRDNGWLPPSLQHRVETVHTWLTRLSRLTPITSVVVETVRFDMQLMRNPDIGGVEYQQGTLAGYTVREYLLEKWNRQCAYCDARNVPLQIEHITARRQGGTDRIDNLALACEPCNQAKNCQPIEQFLAADPARLARIQRQRKAPLKDAAAVNATRYAIGDKLKGVGLPITFTQGGQTKFNRIQQGYGKDHFIDAACLGDSGAAVFIAEGFKPLQIKAMGRGTRKQQACDKFGFPKGKPRQRIKRVHGFQTGDFVKLVKPTGKDAGTYQSRLTSIRAKGHFYITVAGQRIFAAPKYFTLLQRNDGYQYA